MKQLLYLVPAFINKWIVAYKLEPTHDKNCGYCILFAIVATMTPLSPLAYDNLKPQL